MTTTEESKLACLRCRVIVWNEVRCPKCDDLLVDVDIVHQCMIEEHIARKVYFEGSES